ncbi:MAG TPA: hypothetical protein VGR45_16890, partial [Stellaceae bacterium]|nr:hypothetical protein [Stellaceae bacterium]
MKRLILACMIAIAVGATLAWHNPPAQAFLNSFVSVPISSNPVRGCGSPPSMAVAAGFTTCAANYDFTATTG